MICEERFRRQVLALVAKTELALSEFAHPEVSVLAACYRRGIPFTVHAGIGTDVIDQHPSFDGQAKGGCSGRDFLIYTNEVCKLTQGGVILNIGSAVTGPEVLLKAVSMAANVGSVPQGILTADFDLREHEPRQMTDEAAAGLLFPRPEERRDPHPRGVRRQGALRPGRSRRSTSVQADYRVHKSEIRIRNPKQIK